MYRVCFSPLILQLVIDKHLLDVNSFCSVSYETAALGFATTVIPRWFTYYASTILFAIFGLRMLRDGWKMSPDEGQEELEEVQAELKKRDEEVGFEDIF